MSIPGMDVQVFRETGTWRKPPGTTDHDIVEVLLHGANDGETAVTQCRAGQLPAAVPVTVGLGNAAGGPGCEGPMPVPHDGVAVILTRAGT